MAIQPCQECGKAISDRAESCPHCGAKRINTSKNYGAWAAVTLVAMFLGYCTLNRPTDQHPAETRLASPSQSICSAAQFIVLKTKIERVSGYATLTGKVRNTCSIPMGVRLKWTAETATGFVAFSKDFFPAHTNNIMPGEDFAFETSHDDPTGRWRYRVEPVEVFKW